MSESCALLVRHRHQDLDARTAEDTIRKRLEEGERLLGLGREECWEFIYREGSGLRERLEVLAESANLFVNPNKHLYRFSDGWQSGALEQGVLLLVRNQPDLEGPLALETLQKEYGCEGLQEVRYGTLWILRIAGSMNGPLGDERELAERFAITRSRGDGLLVNPHFQTWEWEIAE